MLTNDARIAYIQNAISHLEDYIGYLEDAQAAPSYEVLVLASKSYDRYMQILAVLQNQNVVHVNCDLGNDQNTGFPLTARVRTHPSFYGGSLGAFAQGSVLINLEERADNPTGDTASSNWVRISPYGAEEEFVLWVRRQDPQGNIVLIDGQPTSCEPIYSPSLITIAPLPTPTFSSLDPGCTRSGTCITGNESVEYQTAFILACEAGAITFTTPNPNPNAPDPIDTLTAFRAMTDIAYVVRGRIQANGFPNTLLEVISQGSTANGQNIYQFQCYGEGSSDDLAIPISIAAPIAENLTYNLQLPQPSFPEVQSALFFYGLLVFDVPSFTANSISISTVENLFTGAIGPQGQTITYLSAQQFRGIYLGHGPISQVSPDSGFTTFFFSDDPEFTGYIPQ